MTKKEIRNHKFFIHLGQVNLQAFKKHKHQTHLRPPEFKKTLSNYLTKLEKLNKADKKVDKDFLTNSYYNQNHPNNINHQKPSNDDFEP